MERTSGARGRRRTGRGYGWAGTPDGDRSPPSPAVECAAHGAKDRPMGQTPRTRRRIMKPIVSDWLHEFAIERLLIILRKRNEFMG